VIVPFDRQIWAHGVGFDFFDAHSPRSLAMKPIELFGVLLKTLGVCLVVIGVSQVPYMTAMARAFTDEYGFIKMFMTSYGSITISVAVGYVLLFKTDWLANLTYAKALPEDDDGMSDVPPQSSDA
jgi:hypothetical protein